MKSIQSDISIVGAGIVGLFFAHLIIKHTDYTVTLVDQQKTILSSQRVVALNALSIDMLRHVGIWDALHPYAASYQHMYVWDSFGGEIQFDAPDLGVIVENDRVQQALWDSLSVHPRIKWILGEACQFLHQEEVSVKLQTDNHCIESRYLVAADGARSWVRETLGIAMKSVPLPQVAIITKVKTERSHAHTAWQKFTEQGTLAFLPLVDEHECSIVWSVDEKTSTELLALNDEAFSQRLAFVFESRLGNIEQVGLRQSFAVGTQYTKTYLKDRVVLIGDAAHRLHPFAGQGLNVGLQDVLRLADAFIPTLPEQRALRAFERERKSALFDMAVGLEAIRHAFLTRVPVLQMLVNVGVKQVNQHEYFRSFFTKMALGRHVSLPVWFK